MIGGMLAGHDECDGKVEDGVMKFYGMASESAMTRHSNHNDYRGTEGKTVEVEYRGKANDTIKDILSGIRSACTYVGANKLKDLSKIYNDCKPNFNNCSNNQDFVIKKAYGKMILIRIKN